MRLEERWNWFPVGSWRMEHKKVTLHEKTEIVTNYP